MDTLYRFLFPSKPDNAFTSLLLLALRLLFGCVMLTHGIQKWNVFEEMSASFPDPLGVGGSISMGLAIFAELFCSVGLIFGVLQRLVLIPLIFTMCVALFVIHAADPFAQKELALIYLVVYIILYIGGPGKFSIDHFLGKALPKRR